MKKIFVLIISFLFCVQVTLAKTENKEHSLKFNGQKYYLLYSVKNKEFGGYLNEYYKKGDTYNIWTEMIAVHHFPNAYSPIDRIKDFKDYLSGMQVPSSLTFDDKKNSAMIDFILITNKQMPVILEFNIFKYEKSKKCGSIAIQYAKRYSATTTMQIEEIKKDFERNRKLLIKKLKNYNIPNVITENIDKCISGAELNKEARQEIKEENKLIEQESKTENLSETVDNIESQKIETIQEEKSAESEVIEPKEIQELDKPNEDINSDINEQTQTITNEEKEALESNNKEENKSDIEICKSEEKVENISEEPKEQVEQKINEDKKENIETAPIPDINNKKSNKPKKEVCYQIINDKNEFIAKPRTNKEIKAQNKIYKKNLKSVTKVTNNNQYLIAKPRTKKELKKLKKSLDKKRKAKEKAKKAMKKLSE